MLGIPVRENKRKVRSPDIIGELIYKILKSEKCKARYQPGKRFVPDILSEKFPT